MSTKEEWQNWRTDTDKRLNQIAEDMKKAASLGDKEKPKPKNEHPLHTFDDLLECPDCYPKLKNKVLAKEFKDKELVKCVGCGVPEDKEAEKCWNCGSTEAETF